MASVQQLCLAVALTATAVAPPDLTPPGTRRVSTQVVFELADAVRGQRFAVSVEGRPPESLRPGRAEPLWSDAGLQLFALAPDEVPPVGDAWSDRAETWAALHARTDVPVPRDRMVPLASPVVRYATTVRVLGTRRSAIDLELSTIGLDAFGLPVDENALRVLWIGAALVGAAGLWVLGRRRRARSNEAAESAP